jgi:hypothetical protein
MKTKNIDEIARMDSYALTAIIDYWKEFDTFSVLIAYGELKRRNFNIPVRLIKTMEDFCKINNSLSFDDLLIAYLKEYNCENYDQYFHNKFPKKDIIFDQSDENTENKYIINTSNIVAAGRGIKSVVYVIIVLISISLFGLVFAAKANDSNSLVGIYLFMGITSFLCNIIILVLVYNVGDKLEHSIKIK